MNPTDNQPVPLPQPKFVFVLVEMPKRETVDELSKQWRDFVNNVRSQTPPCEGLIEIPENVWLLPLPNGLPFLIHVLEAAKNKELRTRILFLQNQEDLAWSLYPPKR